MRNFFSKDLRNNFFLLKICFKSAPLYTTWYMIDKIRNEILIFAEHVLAIQFVLHAVEFGRPFRGVLIFLGLLFTAEIFHMWVDAYRQMKLAPKAMPVINQRMMAQLFDKAREIDLESYDNPTFYNDYVMAINESGNQVDRILMTMERFVSSVTRILLAGGFFIVADPISFVFVLASFLLLFFMETVVNKLNFKITLLKNPIFRKFEYINRVFYLPDYAKELRLNPSAAEKLQQDHININDELQTIDKKYAKKLWILNWLKDHVFSDFIMTSLFMLYLVFSAVVLGRISIGSVVVFSSTAWMLRSGLNSFSRTVTDIVDISRYVERIHVFLGKKPQIISAENKPAPTGRAFIELRNISFRYTEDLPYVLQNVSMTINPGEKAAIVGYNGAGKSTLVKLIMRLYDPTDGDILLNGVNIKAYDVEAYRRAIGVIFQDYKIFAATVKENVLLDILEKENVRPALTQAGFAERLDSLPLGLETNLTTEFEADGVNLSGGESQKVAIARAFYKDSPLIILDEPSSALDPIAEYHFNHAVTTAGGDKTMIFISHRLSTTRVSDRIFLLEHGKLEECGTHEELLARKGRYADMWDAQTANYIKAKR